MGSGVTKEPSPKEIKLNIYHEYKYNHVVGKGGFAVVYEAYHRKEKKYYAIKETNFSHNESQSRVLDMALTELEVFKVAGCHPFLVKLHCAFREGPCSYLVLDPLLGGDLRYHLRNFQIFRETHVAYFVACIGSALHHLHQRGILHRDVKPENVILGTNGIPYLTDFGTAFVDTEKRVLLCSSSSGTMPYLSPEALTTSRRHSYQNDFWSLGVLAYELLFNVRPFEKHCPKDYIYFVDNQYRLMWDYVMENNDLKRASEAQTPPISPLYSPGSHHPSLPSQFDYFDFEKAAQSIDEDTRLSSLPYPQYQIHLLENGEVPPELQIRLPPFSYSGELLTLECRSMLLGLMDVRIPQRLGNIHRFSDFSRHPWLLSNGCIHEILQLFQAKFVPDVNQIRNVTRLKFLHYPSPYNSRSQPPVILPQDVEEKLFHFNYLPQTSDTTQHGMKDEKESIYMDTECSNSVAFQSRSRSRISFRTLKSNIDPLRS